MTAQTLKPEEILIAVDGSIGDELRNVIEEYRQGNNTLFTVCYYPKNRGLGAVLHDALLLCRNDFIARMDADDYSVPERIEKQAEIFRKYPELNVVGCIVDEFEDDISHPVAHVILPEKPEDVLKFARRRSPMRHPCMLYRKSEIIAVGNYRNVYHYEDYDLQERILHKKPGMGGGIYNIQEVLVYMRISKDFYRRRGGIRLMYSSLKMKARFLKDGFISLPDFIISGFGQALVTLMPGFLREWFYKKFLRK